jgi:hypothetical protein
VTQDEYEASFVAQYTAMVEERGGRVENLRCEEIDGRRVMKGKVFLPGDVVDTIPTTLIV